MGLEQRGRVRWLHERNNWKQEDLDACDKQTVPYREALGVEAYQAIRSNGKAAGVDG